MKCHKSKEIQTVKEYYHSLYLEIWFTIYSSFGVAWTLLQIIFILFYQNNLVSKSAVAFPLVGYFVGATINYIVSKNKMIINKT